jgi:hypothetical protein|tara:strand:+ start:52 stop:615 length:564 start_codon:yes stop_codon:yes gene_type:complete
MANPLDYPDPVGARPFGLGSDPRDILHRMKTEAREELKEPSIATGSYEGFGGYRYEVMPGGEIKIIEAPGGRGVGVTLKSGHPAHAAISEELKEKEPTTFEARDPYSMEAIASGPKGSGELPTFDDPEPAPRPKPADEGAAKLYTRRTKSAQFDDMPGLDSPGSGVVSGEGRSGKERARVETAQAKK